MNSTDSYNFTLKYSHYHKLEKLNVHDTMLMNDPINYHDYIYYLQSNSF